MKIKFIQDFIDFIRAELEAPYNKGYKLFYVSKSEPRNAGDVFNETLMEYFNIPYKKTLMTNTNLLCVGSLLQKTVVAENEKIKPQKSKDCILAGVGFISAPEGKEKPLKNYLIKAVRGKLTQKRLEEMTNQNLDNCVLADPGLLASYIFPKRKNIKYKVGIIPHMIDKKSTALENIRLKNYSYTFIDINQKVEKVLEDINECECILSSSLHGLVFSDSYGIPGRQIILSDNVIGGVYKFRDYYSCYNMELPRPIDLRQETIEDNLINEIIEEYTNRVDEIKLKQQKLVEIYKEIANRKF